MFGTEIKTTIKYFKFTLQSSCLTAASQIQSFQFSVVFLQKHKKVNFMNYSPQNLRLWPPGGVVSV